MQYYLRLVLNIWPLAGFSLFTAFRWIASISLSSKLTMSFSEQPAEIKWLPIKFFLTTVGGGVFSEYLPVPSRWRRSVRTAALDYKDGKWPHGRNFSFNHWCIFLFRWLIRNYCFLNLGLSKALNWSRKPVVEFHHFLCLYMIYIEKKFVCRKCMDVCVRVCVFVSCQFFVAR